jgi:hypothetical protein
MNVSALAAGWPFAILLMLYARCDDRAPLCGMVIEKDRRSKALVLERDRIVYPATEGNPAGSTGGHATATINTSSGDPVRIPMPSKGEVEKLKSNLSR